MAHLVVATHNATQKGQRAPKPGTETLADRQLWPAQTVPADPIARDVAVGDTGLKLSKVGGAEIKANVITHNARNIVLQSRIGDPLLGVEY